MKKGKFFLLVAIVVLAIVGVVASILVDKSVYKTRPVAMAINDEGNLFVGYNTDKFCSIISNNGTAWKISRSAVDAKEIWIKDLVSDGQYLYVACGEFINPGFIGHYQSTVYKFTNKGELVEKWEGTEAVGGGYPFHEANYLAISPVGLFVSDTNSHCLRLLDTPDGQPQTWGMDGLKIVENPDGTYEWMRPQLEIMPAAIASYDDTLAVVDILPEKPLLRFFKTSGEEVSSSIVLKKEPREIAMDGQFVYSIEGKRVVAYRYNPGGSPSKNYIDGIFMNPVDIALRKGTIYVVDHGGVFGVHRGIYSKTPIDLVWQKIQ